MLWMKLCCRYNQDICLCIQNMWYISIWSKWSAWNRIVCAERKVSPCDARPIDIFLQPTFLPVYVTLKEKPQKLRIRKIGFNSKNEGYGHRRVRRKVVSSPFIGPITPRLPLISLSLGNGRAAAVLTTFSPFSTSFWTLVSGMVGGGPHGGAGASVSINFPSASLVNASTASLTISIVTAPPPKTPLRSNFGFSRGQILWR